MTSLSLLALAVTLAAAPSLKPPTEASPSSGDTPGAELPEGPPPDAPSAPAEAGKNFSTFCALLLP